LSPPGALKKSSGTTLIAPIRTDTILTKVTIPSSYIALRP
jgi:hypothetical protein